MGFLPKWPMSAYSASQPVTASTTAPSETKATQGACRNINSAYRD